MAPSRHILAMGGGGFSMEPDNLGLDRRLLSLSGKPKPKVCFIPTASGDSADYLARFYKAMEHLDAEPSHLSLFKLDRCAARGLRAPRALPLARFGVASAGETYLA